MDSQDSRDKVVKYLITGLMANGAQHKQFYLEQAFRALCEDEYVDKAKEEFGWEDGGNANKIDLRFLGRKSR